MKPKAKSIIQFAILLGLGFLLVWLAFRSVASEKDKIISAFKNADYFWVFVSCVIGFFSHFLRAYRWNHLLEPLGYRTNLFNANAAVMVGYFANYGLPRMGEISRCTLADRYDKVPFQVGFGTVVTERIIDTILLLVIFGLTLIFQFTELIDLSNKYIFFPLSGKIKNLYHNPILAITIIICLIGGILTFYMLRKKIAEKLKGKFGNIIKGFFEGLSSVRKMKNLGSFILLSVLIWTMYFYSLYTCLKALPETAGITHAQSLTLMVFGTLGIVFTPGGLGAYHLIIAEILVFYGVAQVPSVAFPWLVWTSQFIMILILGVLSLVLLPILNKNKDGVSPKTH